MVILSDMILDPCMISKNETTANDLDEMNDWRTVTIENRFQVSSEKKQYLSTVKSI